MHGSLFSVISSQVLFEDNHFIIVNKQSGQIIQGDKTGDGPLSDLVKEFIKKRDNKPGNVFLGVAHRIDRPVSGAVLFAKTSKALSRINQMIQDRNFHKTYWAIVKNKPPEAAGTLVNWLRKNEKQNKSYVFDSEESGTVKAMLNYKLLASGDHYHLLEIELLTGRHHQIRAQLGHIGCFIKGDIKYGALRTNDDASISLHARKLQFTHPVKGDVVEVAAPVPEDKLWKYFEKLME